MKKTFISFCMLFLLVINNAFSGGGVTVGDGFPTKLTKQKKIDSLDVLKNTESFVENLAFFEPRLAFIYNLGVMALRDKRISIYQALEKTDEHFAYIEYVNNDIDYENIKNDPDLATIYLYKNYFQLENENKYVASETTKTKVIIHELTHLLFRAPEFKTQRITDLVYKVANLDFTQAEFEALKKETELFTMKINFSKRSPYNDIKKDYNSVGKKFIFTGKNIIEGTKNFDFTDDTAELTLEKSFYLPIIPEKILNIYKKSNDYQKKLIRSSVKSTLSAARLCDTDKYGDIFWCNEMPSKMTEFNYNRLSFKDFIQFLTNNHYTFFNLKSILSKNDFEKIRQLRPNLKSFYIDTEIKTTNQNILVQKTTFFSIGYKSEYQKISLPVNNFQLRLDQVENLQELKKIYENYKAIFTLIFDGSLNKIEPTNDFHLYYQYEKKLENSVIYPAELDQLVVKEIDMNGEISSIENYHWIKNAFYRKNLNGSEILITSKNKDIFFYIDGAKLKLAIKGKKVVDNGIPLPIIQYNVDLPIKIQVVDE